MKMCLEVREIQNYNLIPKNHLKPIKPFIVHLEVGGNECHLNHWLTKSWARGYSLGSGCLGGEIHVWYVGKLFSWNWQNEYTERIYVKCLQSFSGT